MPHIKIELLDESRWKKMQRIFDVVHIRRGRSIVPERCYFRASDFLSISFEERASEQVDQAPIIKT